MMDKTDPHVRRFMDASTSHVSETTRDWLDEQGRIAAAVRTSQDESPAIHIGKTDTGWFFYAPEDTDFAELEVPDDVIHLMQEARKRGCEYVMLDCDADTLDGLPVYEW